MPSVIINGALAVLSPVAWLMLATGVGDPKRLASRGLLSLKYFTVLSNLLSGVVALSYLMFCLLQSTAPPVWLLAAKLMATSAVALTFLTVILLLGPKFGWGQMYVGGNLWMHLILPLLAIIDCVLFVPVGRLPLAVTFVAVVPSILYGIGYWGNLVRHGVLQGQVGETHDFYGFLRWGKEKVPALAVIMFAGSWALGLVLWLSSKLLCAL